MNTNEVIVPWHLYSGELDYHLGTPPQGAHTRLELRRVDETA